MWTISELKQRGKQAFRRNYWHCVLVALILAICVRGFSGGSTGGGNNQGSSQNESLYQNGAVSITSNYLPAPVNMITSAAVSGLAGIIAVFAVAVSLVLSIFVFSVLEIGCRRFFIENGYLSGVPIGRIAFGFNSSYYSNIVVTQFIRGLQIFLWTLLLIIPGIIKSYELRMVPYLVAEFPEMDRRDIFARSKEMMRGEKMNAFVLDLSFLGWGILSAITLGMVGLFYSSPYQYATDAELYAVLKRKVMY